jgi:hypothetical protein
MTMTHNNTNTFTIDKDITITTKLPPIPDTSPLHPNNTHQYQIDRQHAHTAAAAKLHTDMHVTFEMPYNIELSNNPFDNQTHRMVNIKPTNNDPLIGMILNQCDEKQLPQLHECKKGSSTI